MRYGTRHTISAATGISGSDVRTHPYFLYGRGRPGRRGTLRAVATGEVYIGPCPVLPSRLAVTRGSRVPRLVSRGVFDCSSIHTFMRGCPSCTLFCGKTRYKTSTPSRLRLRKIEGASIPVVPGMRRLVARTRAVSVHDVCFPCLRRRRSCPLRYDQVCLGAGSCPYPLMVLSDGARCSSSLLCDTLTTFPPSRSKRRTGFGLLL